MDEKKKGHKNKTRDIAIAAIVLVCVVWVLWIVSIIMIYVDVGVYNNKSATPPSINPPPTIY